MKYKFFIFFLLTFGCIHAQKTKTALFLGNSYTYYNSMPQIVRELALADGNEFIYDSNTPGGYTFQGHSSNTTSLNKIKAQDWDFVVLQEQSQIPAFSPSQVQTDCYPYAAILNDSILANNPCTEPLFFMTWGRKNGDASNCTNYPPICTYDGMQQSLKESYLELAEDNNGSVAPVGMAWKRVRTLFPSINLYNPDESHPSLEGSYLAACVIYVSFFKKSVEGNSFTSSLDSTTAYKLQVIASETVLDSLDTWHLNDNDLNVSLPNDTTYCGDSLELKPLGNIDNILWSTGEISKSIWVDTSGSYSYYMNNNRNCEIYDTISVAIQNIFERNMKLTSCDSLVFDGHVFYSDTSFSESFTGSLGCDSIVNYLIKVDSTVVSNANFEQVQLVKSLGILFRLNADIADSLHLVDSAFNLIYTTNSLNEDYTYNCPLNVTSATFHLLVFNTCKTDTLSLEAYCGDLDAIFELSTSWIVYPNPSKNQLIISNQEQTPFFVSVQDILGRNIILNNFLYAGYASIDVSHLDNGNYFLLLRNEEGLPIGKKMIQKE
jgi:hypothetical protein